MISLGIKDVILYTSLIAFIIYTMKINNMWGVSKGVKKAKNDVKLAKDLQKRRVRWSKFLSLCEWVANNVGGKPDEGNLGELEYRINRLKINIKSLNRNWKPMELYGLLKAIQYIALFLSVIFFLLFKNVLALGLLVLWLAPSTFNVFTEVKINEEDMELEDDFPDLFLLLHNRLLKGATTRLAPTLDDYVKSLDAMYNKKSHLVIRGFATDLRKNIEVWGDDSTAIYKLRDTYRSSMVVNFCNLATQALKGVDNSDKLLAFKIELTNQKQEKMKENARKLIEKGRRSIIVIYIILGQFVILSWLAKLGTMKGI